MTEHPGAYPVRIITARRIVSMTPAEPAALACRGEWVVATGPVSDLRARFPEADVTDLGDVTVVPGFNDAHQHPTICAEQSLYVDLSPDSVHNLGEVTAALSERAARTPPGEWIVGSGLDPARTLGGAELTRAELDTACPDHPVLAVHVTLHSGVLNSQSLRLAGLSDPGDAPPGGELGHDAAGRLTGILHDQALYDVAFPAFTRRPTIVPPPDAAAMERAFLVFADRLHAAGITSVGDAMVGPDGWELLHRLDRRGALPLRVNALVAYEHFANFRALGCAAPRADSRLRIGGVKTFADGAVNGGACWVTEPVIGATGHGSPRMPAEELTEVVREVHDAGWRIAVHANGDRAIEVTLEAIAQAQQANPRSSARHRIEHMSIINDRIVAGLRELGVVAVPFGQYPAAHGDKLRAYYEPERIERMFAHRTLLDAGIRVAGSSDYPCGPYEPLYAMRSCVMRADRNGQQFGAAQRISPAEALALYTTGSAYASAEERTKGQLAPGYLADFVVLGEDPLAVSGDRLARVPLLQTWIGGSPVWSALV
jgi:predicted amidohydrolase YtcJ